MIRYRYTYNRRVAKAPGPMELYFADKLLPRLAQFIKTRLIPGKRKGYKLEVLDNPGEKGVWFTLPGDYGYISIETGYGVTDADGIVEARTDDGLEKTFKLTGNVSADLSDLEDIAEKLHDRFEQRITRYEQ